MTEKCTLCPLKDSDRPCVAIVSRNPRWCQHVDPSSSIYGEGYIRLVLDWEPPTLIDKATGFISAAAHHVAAGLPTADEATRNARLAICDGCLYKSGPSCGICGCNLAAMANWADKECPKGLWPVTEQSRPAS